MTAPFVTSLGVRPETVRLTEGSNSNGNTLTIRVHSAEAWDAVRVEANESTLVRQVKQAALAVLMPDVDAIESFVVKMNGSELRNEHLSLAAAHVKNGATLLVMSRRRHAVR